ncbi:acyltransferase domain-containing protein [Micromonospora sp. M12]
MLFAIMVSLAELWRGHGVQPAAVVGHSQGELAAACVAGAIPLTEAARMVALRSAALAELTGTGAMGSVLMSYADVSARLSEWGGRVTVAAVNGPESVVVSGDVDAVEGLLDRLAGEGVRTRRIEAGAAGHSAHLDPLRQRFGTAFEGSRRRPAPWTSTPLSPATASTRPASTRATGGATCATRSASNRLPAP